AGGGRALAGAAERAADAGRSRGPIRAPSPATPPSATPAGSPGIAPGMTKLEPEVEAHSTDSRLPNGADGCPPGVEILVERILDRAEHLNSLRNTPGATGVGERSVLQQEIVAVIVELL